MPPKPGGHKPPLLTTSGEEISEKMDEDDKYTVASSKERKRYSGTGSINSSTQNLEATLNGNTAIRSAAQKIH